MGIIEGYQHGGMPRAGRVSALLGACVDSREIGRSKISVVQQDPLIPLQSGVSNARDS